MRPEVLKQGPGASIAPVLWSVVATTPNVVMEPERPSIAQQLEQKFQEGKQKGAAEALAVARREAEGQLQAVLQRLAGSIEALSEARQRVREETAADLIRLSLAIASRILHREVTIDADAIHGLVRAAFDKAQSREVTRIAVHPAQEASVRRYLEQSAGARKVVITSDPTLHCGDIRLETSQGQLDASINTQLKEIERGLADRLSN